MEFMEKIVLNPAGYEAEYLEKLNECFNNWGGQREYYWGFNRQIGVHSTDFLIIKNEEEEVIAGSAVSYRKLEGRGKSIDIGIMTGSWTLPAVRGKGCFTRMIHESKDLCKEKNVPYLTAFVTETNASCRRLQSEGSFLFPTYHLFSPEFPFEEEGLPGTEVLQKDAGTNRAVYERVKESSAAFLHFSYNFEEFVGQYIERIKETTILKVNKDFVIIEDGQDEVKILLMTYLDEQTFSNNIMAITNWCLENRSKKTFYFSTRKEILDLCADLGFQNAPGYFTIMSVEDKNVQFEHEFKALKINMADKM